MFGVSLMMTVAVELTAAFVCPRISGLEKRKEFPGRGRNPNTILLVILVNVLTNPAAVLICWLGRLYAPDVPEMAVQLMTETAVVALEAWIYWSFSKKPQWRMARPVLFSIVANLCSWLSGMIVMAIRG